MVGANVASVCDIVHDTAYALLSTDVLMKQQALGSFNMPHVDDHTVVVTGWLNTPRRFLPLKAPAAYQVEQARKINESSLHGTTARLAAQRHGLSMAGLSGNMVAAEVSA